MASMKSRGRKRCQFAGRAILWVVVACGVVGAETLPTGTALPAPALAEEAPPNLDTLVRLARWRTPEKAKPLTDMGLKIVNWTVANLQMEEGLFADSKGLTGELNKARLTYNSALMIRAFAGLYRVTEKKEYLTEAQRIAKAADGFLRRETGVYRDPVKWAHLMVEADLELYRITKEEYLMNRARKNADAYYETWKSNRPTDLISNASIARVLWLMADTETEAGRAFWAASDRAVR